MCAFSNLIILSKCAENKSEISLGKKHIGQVEEPYASNLEDFTIKTGEGGGDGVGVGGWVGGELFL